VQIVKMNLEIRDIEVRGVDIQRGWILDEVSLITKLMLLNL
jgi:hypothetical protein